MTYLKKVDVNWVPREFPNIQVGEIVDFPGPFEKLVREGQALIVDKDGNEQELPGQVFECPVCFEKIQGLKDFTEHVSGHMPKPKEEKAVVEKETEEKTTTDTEAKEADIRAKRLANLAKGRATRLANLKK